MLQAPIQGQHVYEVSIYNREVRSLVKQNQSHLFFDDQWADKHIHDVVALDEDHARLLIAERFPPDDGFIIEDVVQSAI